MQIRGFSIGNLAIQAYFGDVEHAMASSDHNNIVDVLIGGLERTLGGLPNRFLDSFDFTTTGNNLSHPIVWGALCHIAYSAPGVKFVGVDVRLNRRNGIKFQPNIVTYDSEMKPLWMLDYESPNSSDARILKKDVDGYSQWNQEELPIPYIIITTLPDGPCHDWQLRYASKGRSNEVFHGKREELVQNPLGFWTCHYLQEFKKRNMQNIVLLNISGRRIKKIFPV